MKFSEKDPEISKVRQGLIKNIWDESIKSYKPFQNELCCYENILLRGSRIVNPAELTKAVVDAAHDQIHQIPLKNVNYQWHLE